MMLLCDGHECPVCCLLAWHKARQIFLLNALHLDCIRIPASCLLCDALCTNFFCQDVCVCMLIDILFARSPPYLTYLASPTRGLRRLPSWGSSGMASACGSAVLHCIWAPTGYTVMCMLCAKFDNHLSPPLHSTEALFTVKAAGTPSSLH